MATIFYGINDDTYANITAYALKVCEKKDGCLIIPAGDQRRCYIFGDPICGPEKHILVKRGDQCFKIPANQDAVIPLDWF